MRKIFLSLLLASAAATPAVAERPHHNDDSSPRHEERSDRSEARHQRSEARQERSESRQQVHEVRQQARQERVERADRVQAPERSFSREAPVQVQRRAIVERQAIRERQADMSRGDVDVRETVRVVRPNNVNERGRPVLRDRRTGNDSVSQWRERERDATSDRSDVRKRIERRVETDRVRIRPPVGARPDRPAPVRMAFSDSRQRDAWNHRSHWRSDWRDDHRYDWREHRRHHRSTFHLGIYFDPFGWNYHRYSIGWRLWPSYYDSAYWLNDPFMYRLPYAPWPYKWVRYYDDALLVNVYTGQVADVIYDFFW